MTKKAFDPFHRIDPFLRDEGTPEDLTSLIFAIARAGKYVSHAIRNGNLGYSESSNASGESQLALDVLSDNIFCDHLKATGLVASFASEEQDDQIDLPGDGKFSVAFDPLDGSSLVNANFSIGSIFGIFEGNQFLGKTGNDLIASGYIIYGPRTAIIVATKKGIWEFVENAIGEFVHSEREITIAETAKYFAPGNLRATAEREDYTTLVHYLMNEQLTLRYSGGMVPDIHMIFTKGSGIFTYPGHSKYPNGKLRLLYECAPFAFLAKAAGGIALDEFGTPILEKKIEDLHQRTSIFIGSKETVEEAIGILNNH